MVLKVWGAQQNTIATDYQIIPSNSFDQTVWDKYWDFMENCSVLWCSRILNSLKLYFVKLNVGLQIKLLAEISTKLKKQH